MMFKAVIGNRQHEDYGVTPLMGRCRQVEPRMGGYGMSSRLACARGPPSFVFPVSRLSVDLWQVV